MTRQEFILACSDVRKYIRTFGPITVNELKARDAYLPGAIEQLKRSGAIRSAVHDGVTYYSASPMSSVKEYDVKADLSYENEA